MDRTAEIVYKDLRKKIESGYYSQGTKLEDEKDLAEAYGVRRHTIRLAIKKLAEEGVVKRIKGRGTFVAAEIQKKFLGLIEDSWQFRVLKSALSNSREQYSLFSEGSPVLNFEILWLEDDKPVCYEKCLVDVVKNPHILQLMNSQQKIHPVEYLSEKLSVQYIQEIYEIGKLTKSVSKHLQTDLKITIFRTIILKNQLDEVLALSILKYHPGVQIKQIRKV
ncbi:GntR family transcriptional regulator [Pseudothermotoga sp.]|uniref:GntR family transcriptional regulator n=1 Tax=Pseudothermotoga sp. TaxID=2033661 RepID=UPI00258AD6E1|nr:GntR family transcriptional regulator [Pseudothermotoga sp.]MDK2884952.1 hypothetical protein [Pseudothermotoga sp.]